MEFEDILKKINKTRPFKMYMHGSRDGRVIEPVFDEHENFRIMYGRGNIYSSFVNCGTTNTDFVDRFKNYYYAGSRFNVIMAVPDAVQVSNYCGCVKGNDATSQGYSNPVEVDYQVAGARCALSKVSGELADIVGSSHLDEVPNELILGYYDTLTHEFHINENCILLAGNEKYKSFVEKATQCAEEIYFADVRAGIFQDYCLDSELEDSKKFREIIHDKEKMMDFIAGARFDYMFSEECKLYSDIENASFRNNVHFPSNVYRSLESYLSEKTDELTETQEENMDDFFTLN